MADENMVDRVEKAAQAKQASYPEKCEALEEALFELLQDSGDVAGIRLYFEAFSEREIQKARRASRLGRSLIGAIESAIAWHKDMEGE